MKRLSEKDIRLDRLIEEHYKTLYRIAYSRCRDPEIAKDAVQDTATKFTEQFIEKEHYQELSDDILKRILYVILNRRVSNMLRDEARRNKHLLSYESDPAGPSLEAIVFSRFDAQIICDCINELPEEYRTYFHLNIETDLTKKDIAELLGVKESSLRSILSRARKLLKEACEAKDVEVGLRGKRKK